MRDYEVSLQRDLKTVKRLLVTLLKVGVSAAIIGWLFYKAAGDKTFSELAHRPKHWGVLGAALLICLVGTVITFARWQMLVRAAGIPLAMRDAMRLGFLGYLLNFVSPGSVGGDLFKAVFLVREHPSHRGAAIASVVADRLMGLFSLMLLCSGAILLYDQIQAPNEVVRDLCWGVLGCTLLGAVGLGVLLWPGFTQGKLANRLRSAGRLGRMFDSLFNTMDRYRSRPSVLVIGVLAGIGVQACFTIVIYMVARGVPGHVPDLSDHFIIAPLAMLAGAMPFAFGGLGAFEGAARFAVRVRAGWRTLRRQRRTDRGPRLSRNHDLDRLDRRGVLRGRPARGQPGVARDAGKRGRTGRRAPAGHRGRSGGFVADGTHTDLLRVARTGSRLSGSRQRQEATVTVRFFRPGPISHERGRTHRFAQLRKASRSLPATVADASCRSRDPGTPRVPGPPAGPHCWTSQQWHPSESSMPSLLLAGGGLAVDEYPAAMLHNRRRCVVEQGRVAHRGQRQLFDQ